MALLIFLLSVSTAIAILVLLAHLSGCLKLKIREWRIKKLWLKLFDDFSQQNPPDYGDILDACAYAYDLDIDVLEQIKSWIKTNQEQLKFKQRELKEEEERLQAWKKELTEESQKVHKYLRRWDDARQDLNTELHGDLLVFSLDECPENAFIMPDPAELYYDIELRRILNSFLKELNHKKQQTAIELRFGLTGGEPMTYKEIGEQMGISGSAVGVHIKNGLRRLRHPIRGRLIKDFW